MIWQASRKDQADTLLKMDMKLREGRWYGTIYQV